MKKLLIFFLPAILLGCDSPAYRNPLDVAFGDPFILHAADGKFYMYGTSGDIRGFRVCVSDDLVTWQKGDVVYDDEQVLDRDFFGLQPVADGFPAVGSLFRLV